MRMLVTGGAGFIGSALVRYLVGGQNEVLNIDKLTYAGCIESLTSVADRPNYRFLKADICDRRMVSEALETFRPDWVMHLAAESHVDRSIMASSAFVQTNVVGTHTLLEAAREYWMSLPASDREKFRFLHVSTDEVYGTLGETGLFSEHSPYDPSSPYSASKAASDHLAKAWFRTYGLPVIVSNCSNNYGPYQFPEKLIPLTILNALENKRLPVYGAGINVRDWLFVDDHVKALETIVARGRAGETYNVGGRSEQRNIDVVRKICSLLDILAPASDRREKLIEFVPDRPGHDARYAIDSTKLERELTWTPLESFESGLEKTVRWYIESEWWWRPLTGRFKRERLGIAPAAAGG